MKNRLISILGAFSLILLSSCSTFDVLLINASNQKLNQCSLDLRSINSAVVVGDLEPKESIRRSAFWIDGHITIGWQDSNGDKQIATAKSPQNFMSDKEDKELILVILPDGSCVSSSVRRSR